MPPAKPKSATDGYTKTPRKDAKGRVIWKSKAGADRVRCKSTSGPAAGKLVWRKPATQKPKPAAAAKRRGKTTATAKGGGDFDYDAFTKNPFASVPQEALAAVDPAKLEHIKTQFGRLAAMAKAVNLHKTRNGIDLTNKLKQMIPMLGSDFKVKATPDARPDFWRYGGGGSGFPDDIPRTPSDVISRMWRLAVSDDADADMAVTGAGAWGSKQMTGISANDVTVLQVKRPKFQLMAYASRFGRSTLRGAWELLCILFFILLGFITSVATIPTSNGALRAPDNWSDGSQAAFEISQLPLVVLTCPLRILLAAGCTEEQEFSFINPPPQQW